MQAVYFIWSNEHRAWWMAREFGYSEEIATAGLYSRARAIEICAKANRFQKPGEIPNEIPVPAADLMEALGIVAAVEFLQSLAGAGVQGSE